MNTSIRNTILYCAILIALFSYNGFAATFTAVQSGSWNSAATWDLNSVPGLNDNVIIPQAYTININSNQNLGDGQLEVYGTLEFSNSAKLSFDISGVVYIVGQGKILCIAVGQSCNSAQISIGGEVKWKGSDGTITAERAITNDSDPANSPNFLTPIPPQALLPIELLYFEAEMKETAQVEVRWATATEINNEYFAVQRSKDGRNWSTIGEVEGALNSQRTIEYTFTDVKAANGNNFYRLVQFDTDGDYSISNTVVVKSSVKAASGVYPNPSSGRFHFTITSEISNQNIKVYNANGQLIDQIQVSDQLTTVDLTENQSGSYYYQIDNGQEITQTGMIIKN